MEKEPLENRFSDEVRVWKEQEAIHIKTFNPHNDPVELTILEARSLAKLLNKLADEIDA